MIDMYLTDFIDIISIAVDEWGTSNQSVVSNVPARIEDTNKIVFDANGKELVGNILVMVNSVYKIKSSDKIRIRKKAGVSFDIKDKMFAIKSLGEQQGFTATHWEIYL